MKKKMKASRGVLYEVLCEFVRDYGNAILTEWDEIYGLSEEERDELGNFSSYPVSQMLSFASDVAEECESDYEEVA